MYRHSHITRYHKSLLKLCNMCRRWYMFPWDFNRHLDFQHRKCEECQQYLNDDDVLQDHMELKHPTVTVKQVETEAQITTDQVTLDTSRQDCQVKCKYCNRYFGSLAECNMHINRRHKRLNAPSVKTIL